MSTDLILGSQPLAEVTNRPEEFKKKSSKLLGLKLTFSSPSLPSISLKNAHLCSNGQDAVYSAVVPQMCIGSMPKSQLQQIHPLKRSLADADRAVFEECIETLKLAQNPKYSHLLPEDTGAGKNGAYFLKNRQGEKIAIFKPQCNELGVRDQGNAQAVVSRRGIQPGTQMNREVAAYLLDSSIGAGVAPTVLMTLQSEKFENVEPMIGSVQLLVPNRGSLKETDIETVEKLVHDLSDEEIQKLALLDLRLSNGDRHGGNLLIAGNQLAPIDHGCILPAGFSDTVTYCWKDFDHPALHRPFDLQRIQALQIEKDDALLKDFLPDNARQKLRIMDFMIKKGTEIGLTPYQMASLLYQSDATLASAIDFSPLKTLEKKMGLRDEDQFCRSLEQMMRQAKELFHIHGPAKVKDIREALREAFA